MTSPAETILAQSRRPDVLAALRAILLDCGLSETVKWRQLCYVADGANVAILQDFKDACALMFFKGALLHDVPGLLEPPGPNSRAARRVRVSRAAEVATLEPALRDFIRQAVELQRAGAAVPLDPPAAAFPRELQERLDRDPRLRAAFLALTPGRQRAYALHVGGAKRAATRARRAEACLPRILAGKGLRDR